MRQFSILLTLLRRCGFRHWRYEPGSTALLLAIVALGVGVFVSIRLANQAAVASFTRFTDTLTGQSDWLVQAPVGTLPESVLPEMRSALGARPVHLVPVLQATGSPPVAADETDRFGRPSYTILGVDLLGVSNLAQQMATGQGYFGNTAQRGAEATSGGTEDFWTAFQSGPQVWLSPRWGESLPREIELVLDERVLALPVAGWIPTAPGAPEVPPNLIVMDLPKLQQLTGRVGQIDRIELVLESGPRADERRSEIRQILERLGADETRWIVSSPGAERETAATMTRAFRLNLTVLSLIALLVGLYLIFQALDGAVVRRRSEIAVLRSLGVEIRMIRTLWWLESATIGLIGGGLGVGLGWLGAQGAVRAVGQTVNALYFETTVQAAGLSVGDLGLGLGLGVVSGLFAGWWPARTASRTPPAQLLQRGLAPAEGSWVLRSVPLACGLIALGVAFTFLPAWRFEGGGRFPVAGYAAAFLWIFGGGILSAWLLPHAARAMEVLGWSGPSAKLALSHLRLPSGRHRLAVAALHCAVGMTAGMAILVGSFDFTVKNWVQGSLQADLYLSSSGAQSANARNMIRAEAAEAIAGHPTVVASNTLVAYPLTLDQQPTLLTGTDMAMLRERSQLPWVDAPRDDAVFDASTNLGLGLVSESFTERFEVGRGDQLQIPTPSGMKEITIVGVFADYGNERGSIVLDRAHVDLWFGSEDVTNLSLWLRPGADAETVRADLLTQHPGLALYTNAVLRAEVLRIFRQTFAITYALEIIGVLVAVIGLALTLTSVLLDRRDELTTLRAIGFKHREIARATAIEGATVAGAAVVGGTVLSLALGWLLIYVVNKQSFGWTLGFAIPWGQLGALAVVVVLTGAGVSWAVGRWGANLPADREE
jgi:putative ABC transport system permease protein